MKHPEDYKVLPDSSSFILWQHGEWLVDADSCTAAVPVSLLLKSKEPVLSSASPSLSIDSATSSNFGPL